jgi:putative colanic acid biosynthesis acetyltransferase WcaF
LSVVNKSLEPGGIYGGNPCKFIRNRFDPDT